MVNLEQPVLCGMLKALTYFEKDYFQNKIPRVGSDHNVKFLPLKDIEWEM